MEFAGLNAPVTAVADVDNGRDRLERGSGRDSEVASFQGIDRSTDRPAHRHLEVQSLRTTIPRAWNADLSELPARFVQQILGLNPFKTSYFSLYRYLDDLESRCILGLGIVCAIAAGTPIPIIGLIFSHIIDNFPPSEHDLDNRLYQLLGVAAAFFVVTWVWSICWGVVGERISRRLREGLVERLLGMDMAFFETKAPDITTVLTSDTQQIQMGTSEKVGLFIQSISYFVAAFTVGFILNAKLTGILFAAVIPSMVIVVVSGTSAVSIYSKKAWKAQEDATNIAKGALDAIQVVQAFGVEDVLAEQHQKILFRAARIGFRKSISGAVMLGLVFFIAYAANALAFFEGSSLVTDGAGKIYAVVFLILDASFVLGQFGPFIQILATAAAAGSKIIGILDQPKCYIDSYDEDGVEAGEATFKEDIVFRDVTFVYPARPTARVLDQINLCFKPGTFTGVVGRSGSGKSTIASLMLRLYDPSSGTISIGSTDITDFNISTLRRQIALVDQEPVLFSGTVFDNIKHGIVDAWRLTEDEVIAKVTQAATDANAHFISSLSNGFHTLIGSRGGVSLSGGQRQRICLARALVRKPSLLILDEATASLDATSEALILQAIKNVAEKGCTVISIAHRLATIKDTDNIIVMNNGDLLEQGSHTELLAKNGHYKALIDAQRIYQSETSPVSSAIDDSSQEFKTRGSFVELSLDPQHEMHDGEDASEQSSMGIIQIIRRCFEMSKPERPLIFLGLIACIASGGIVIGEAIVFGHLVQLINNLDVSNADNRVNFYCLMFFVISLVALFSYSTSGASFGLVSENLIARAREKSLRTIMKQDMAWFSKPHHSPQSLITSIQVDTGNFSGLSGVIMGTILSVATSVLGGIVLAHVVAWKIAIVLLAATPVMIVAGYFRLHVLSDFEERHKTAYNDAAALASEACDAIRTVASFGRERAVLREYCATLEKPYRESLRFLIVGNSMLAFSLAIPYFVYALAYWWGSREVRNGDYSELDFFIVLPALLFSAQMAGQLFSLAPEMARAKSAASNIFNLHDQKPSIMTGDALQLQGDDDTTSEKLESSGSSDTALNSRQHPYSEKDAKTCEVALKSVDFAYPMRLDTLVLQDVNMLIAPGEMIGVVGPSGAGKSSLIALLERFYDPTSGQLLVRGDDIRTVPVSAHRQRLSLVSQEPDLFPGSIYFNIGLGASKGQNVTSDDIEAVCKTCGLHEFIMSLPEGYNTECGQNGSHLSGGQKQRLAIARALLRNPDILILDEATSSLDSHSEQEVQDAIASASDRRTTIVVAHRLSTVQKADKIFVFDKGQVIEVGTHSELLDLGGVYAQMVQAQSLDH